MRSDGMNSGSDDWDSTAQAKTVLLVDDDALARMALSDSLRAADMTVIEATDGDEAWRYLTEGNPVDIVIAALTTGRIQGAELYRRCKASFPQMPILIVTGELGDTAAPSTIATRKPVDIAGTIEMIRKLTSQ